MRNQVFKKLFSVLLALIMAAGLLPASAMAEGWGAMDVDTTPELTETEQPAEPTPAQGEPVAEPTPEQGEPTAEPTDEGIMPANVMPVQAETENNTPTVDETKPLPPTSVGNVNYRAVMLDCGRKYFSVDNIEKLIDTMAQYGYNQLQLSFGNGGCRFLLDKMELVFTDANGATVTLSGDDVTNGIKAGNVAFNGDESVLTETEMSKIIEYANSKKIAIVPMLNMPGHMNWLKASFSGYASGKELDKLDIEKTTARNFGYALLNKYVQYFKEKCEFFHFGADESDYTGDNMTKFLTGCANVIVGAGMIPRAFNDSTRDASMPKSVQVTYWINANYIQSKNASVLDNEGYELINTHGRWYYVVNSGDADDTKSVQYANNVTVELPMLKKDKQGSWPNNLRTYFDYNNSTVSEKNHKGTMFCIWCDNSTGMPAEEIISTESYGALTQLQELAKLYWPGDITTDPETTPTPTPTPDQTNGDTVNVELVVGDETNGSKTFDVVGSVEAKDYITGEDAYIATAVVGKTQGEGEGTVTKVASITSDGSYYISDGNGNYLTLENGTLKNEKDVTKATKWTFSTYSNAFTIESNGYYLLWYNSGYGLSAEKNGTYKSYKLNDDGIIVDSWGYTSSGTAITYTENGWTGSSSGNASPYEYKAAEVSKDALTITATGEGKTEVKVGNTTYKITVTAPEKTETVTVTPSSSVTLNPTIPTDGTVIYTLEANEAEVTLAENGAVSTSEKTGNATVKATVRNAGEKVVAYYTYTITVSDIEWDNVASLTVELWITNRYVGATQATATATGHFVRIAAKDAYVEDGITLASQVPSPAKDANGETDIFWKGVVLQNGEKQYFSGSADDSDKSGKGKDFTQVRYFNNEWQCYYDGNWNGVKEDDTIIAYYMQKFPVSPEINTTTRDFGSYAGENDTALPGWPGYIGYMATAFAVVYPGYTMSPKDDSAIYKETTMLRYATDTNLADKSLTPGIVYAENNSEYEIEKITITRGKHTQNTATWTKNDDITWEKVENDAGKLWYKEEIIWEADNPAYGNIPYVNLDGSEWYAKEIGDSFLILIYLKVVLKDDNLNVVYWDDNANRQINPTTIQIAVKNGVTYVDQENGLKNVSPLQTGEITLPDDAYINNNVGNPQTFNKDITIIDGVASNYRSGIYKYVSADISNDGKTLTLHYDLKQGAGKTFVVDFGLPVAIPFSEFGIESDSAVISFSAANSNMLERDGEYGHGKIDKTNKVVIYTLFKTINNKTAIPVYMYNENGEVIKENGEPKALTVYVIPATNVYYEDSFAKFTDGSGAAEGATWAPVYDPGTDANTNANTTQALEALGNKTNVYGYDDAYKDSTMFSMGSAQKVTVTSDMVTNWTDTSTWPTAQFTFKGTGFDIISLTDNTSGAIFVDVYNVKTGNKEKSVFVDNYYGYTYNSKTNTWDATPEKANTLYQIPVIALRNLPYAEYNVVIKVAYSEYFDHTAEPKGSYSFWLDAVRVYNPMGESKDTGDTYKDDNESFPQYIKLRDAVANADAVLDGNKALFIDGGDTADIATYANIGPNNEVYLANGQAITFKLNVGNAQIETVQIGAKAPMSEGTAKLNVNNAEVVENGLSTATEMYYNIKDKMGANNTFTISNTGSGILSLTNLKITFKEQGSVNFGAMNAEEQAASVMAVRALFAPAPVEPEPEPEPEKTFEPERFEASWSRNVMQGRKATLTVKTSEDVKAITVDGQTIRSYRTRTERVGFGRRAKRVTYREFTYSMVAQETADFSVTAINAEGTESEAITARLTVKTRPNSMRDMWDWFKGWF